MSSTISDKTTPNSGKPSYPYIERLKQLQPAYPALRCFLEKIEDSRGVDAGNDAVIDAYSRRFGRLPGRCVLLTFKESGVDSKAFETPDALDVYLTQVLAEKDNVEQPCRLWLLEDLVPAWVDVLGRHLGVSPAIFSEQMNTWNFYDSASIPTRIPPSMKRPHQYFTLRYYEFRQLTNPKAIDVDTNQATFALNRRRYERWRDVDTTSFRSKWRHAFVRRCASFWTNQKTTGDGQTTTGNGWDAVMLLDPPFDSFEWTEGVTAQANGHIGLSKTATPACTILQDPIRYGDHKAAWNARDWILRKSLRPASDTSTPYHGGSTTLADLSLATEAGNDRSHALLQEQPTRNLCSPLDEMVFHWTKLADQDLISSARRHSVNTAHYLLKYLATSWMNQLDLVECGVAQSEFFADDHEETIGLDKVRDAWKKEFLEITHATSDMNYMKRQINHFERALTLNMERLGLIIGAETVKETAPQAIKDAQIDFITIRARLRPLCEHVAQLSGVANELANLHMAFRSINDSELSLRLSLFASIVFPATLITSLLSMGDDFLPGKDNFWVFWAVAVPLCAICAGTIFFGRKPEKWLEHWLLKLNARRKAGKEAVKMA